MRTGDRSSALPSQGFDPDSHARTIPRIIHQIWSSGPMPEPWANAVARLKTDNPGWEHRLYDERAIEALIRGHYGRDMLKTYRRIDPRYFAARSDLFRYLAVHATGGVYLDVKSGASRPLDAIIAADDSYLLAQWRNGAGERHARNGLHRELAHIAGGEFQQWHVIAAPGHPFLAAVIERVLANLADYDPNRVGTGWMGVLRTTGPIPYTLAIAPLLDRHPHRRVANEIELGLVYNESGEVSRKRPGHYSHLTDAIVLPPDSRSCRDWWQSAWNMMRGTVQS